MFHSSSAFGVVASSSPQIVVLDHRIYTIEAIDNDDNFFCDQSLQSYSDLPLDLSVRKQNNQEHNGIPSEKAALMGCNSDQINNLVLGTEISAENTASEIKITNVRSLATNPLADETGSLQDETSREASVETFPERNPNSDINQHIRIHSISDDQSNLNNGGTKARQSPNHLTIRASPSSIHGLKRIRPRPYLRDAFRNGNELALNNKTTTTMALCKDHSKSVRHFRSLEQMRNSDKSGRKHQTQTCAMQDSTKKRYPMFISPSSHARFNAVMSGLPTTSSLESTNQQQLQSSSALASGLDTQTIKQYSAPNSSPQNVSERIFPSHTAPANFSSKPRIHTQNRMKSSYLCPSPKSSGGKNGIVDRPLSDELLADLEVVRVHRRPYFQCKDSRELVEVRPRGVADAPTLLAYRDVSGRILVDWTAKSNNRAAEKIKKLMQSNPERTSHQDHDQVSGPAHKAASIMTAQCPSDVMSLFSNGVIYTISNQ